MPIYALNVGQRVSAAGWLPNPVEVATINTSNDVRATDGIAGEFLLFQLLDVPADFDSLNSVTIKVEARVVGTVNRPKTLTMSIENSVGTVFESLAISNLTATDAVYSSAALPRSYTATEINGWWLRAAVTEGGGMPDSATVEIDRMWVEIDYTAIAANLDLTLSGTDGADNFSATVETPLELTMSGTDGADIMSADVLVLTPQELTLSGTDGADSIDATVTVETPDSLIPKLVPPVTGMIFTT